MQPERSAAARAQTSTVIGQEAPFLPGTLIAGRYRVIDLVGRGGMGEVYRATDLVLGQTVALKFLPEAAGRDPEILERFYNEVRIARQVSHPNVCRVFDIGEADGRPFLSMEYVDGEDLGSLLRRIGRVPGDKAVEIARKLCAGLAAAHEKGVLHRDLKPSNVMIDGRGEVLITDFGLAAVASRIQGKGTREGTPAYMAPEQLADQEVSVRSDIYSLGLVLYEMFTGKRAFEANTLADLVRVRESSTPASLSVLVQGLDPAIERIILRCLETDPRNRPASALAVAAALPGGDPLAAALAAGETPSPEMVAAAQQQEGFRPGVALGFLVFIFASLVLIPLVKSQTSLIATVPFDSPQEALAAFASRFIRFSGYAAGILDTAEGFRYDSDYLAWLDRTRPPDVRHWLASGRPPAILFWYRASPRFLASDRYSSLGVISESDPAETYSGMVRVELDPQGRLYRFEAVPRQIDSPQQQANAPDWRQMFFAAGLRFSNFTAATPEWTPPVAFDAHAAWTGTYPDSSTPLRVEAASWHGAPVYFQLIGPWSTPQRMTTGRPPLTLLASRLILSTSQAVVLILACILARRNVRNGRGDRKGALRLGVVLFCLAVAGWALNVHYVPPEAQTLLSLGLSYSLYTAAWIWLLYIALEPYVRRRWPQTMISWSRMLAGQFRDPLVGSHLMIGIAAGILVLFSLDTVRWLQVAWGGTPAPTVDLGLLAGPVHWIGHFSGGIPDFVYRGLWQFFLLFILRALLRKEWLAAAAFVFIFTLYATLDSRNYAPLVIALHAFSNLVVVLVLIRFGLLARVAGTFTYGLLTAYPITAQLASPYAGAGLFALAVIAALAAFAFHSALAGRPLLKAELLEP